MAENTLNARTRSQSVMQRCAVYSSSACDGQGLNNFTLQSSRQKGHTTFQDLLGEEPNLYELVHGTLHHILGAVTDISTFSTQMQARYSRSARLTLKRLSTA